MGVSKKMFLIIEGRQMCLLQRKNRLLFFYADNGICLAPNEEMIKKK